MAIEPFAVSVPEACRLLGGIGRTKLYALIKEGRLQATKVGSRTLIRVASIHALLNAQEA